jgi:hypothetical protein
MKTPDKITENSFMELEALGFALGIPLGRMQHWSTAVVRQAIHEWIQRRLDDPATRETVLEILANPQPVYFEATRAQPGYRKHLHDEVVRRDATDAWLNKQAAEEEAKNLKAAVDSGKAAILESEREKRRTDKPRS